MTFLKETSDAVMAIYREVDQATQALSSKTGLTCLKGCGTCCLNPQIEVTPGEMLPLAFSLVKRPEIEKIYQELLQEKSSICLQYESTFGTSTQGACRNYPYRPLVCRLFGFAAISSKDGKPPRLSVCKTQKEFFAGAITTAETLLNSGGEVPRYDSFSIKIRAITQSSELATPAPINRALRIALEKVSLLEALTSQESDTSFLQDPNTGSEGLPR